MRSREREALRVTFESKDLSNLWTLNDCASLERGKVILMVAIPIISSLSCAFLPDVAVLTRSICIYISTQFTLYAGISSFFV